MGTTEFDQGKLLKEMGEYDSEGMCYALSLYWIKLHATDWGGQGDANRAARIGQLKKIIQDAFVLQNEYEAVSSQFKRSYAYDWTEKKNIATLKLALVDHYCKKIKSIELVKPAKMIKAIGNSEAEVSDLVDFICDAGTYHLLSMAYSNGKGHANATYYGGAWFSADTYLFEPNGFEGDAFNKASLKEFLKDRVKTHEPQITSMVAIKIRKSAT